MKEHDLIEAADVGPYIRMLRERHGVSQSVMGKAVGVLAPQVSKLENGHYHLKIAMVAAMLDVLGYRVRFEVSPK